jgi:hypothetical protein
VVLRLRRDRRPKPALCSLPAPSLDGFERAFARGKRELPLLKVLKGAIIAAKPLTYVG